MQSGYGVDEQTPRRHNSWHRIQDAAQASQALHESMHHAMAKRSNQLFHTHIETPHFNRLLKGHNPGENHETAEYEIFTHLALILESGIHQLFAMLNFYLHGHSSGGRGFFGKGFFVSRARKAMYIRFHAIETVKDILTTYSETRKMAREHRSDIHIQPYHEDELYSLRDQLFDCLQLVDNVINGRYQFTRTLNYAKLRRSQYFITAVGNVKSCLRLTATNDYEKEKSLKQQLMLSLDTPLIFTYSDFHKML